MAVVFEGEDQRIECVEAFTKYVRSKHLKLRGGKKIQEMEEFSVYGGVHVDAGNGHYSLSSWDNPDDPEGITTVTCSFEDKKYQWKLDNRPRTLFLEAIQGESRPRFSLDEIEHGRKKKDSWMEDDFTWGIVREGDAIFASVAQMRNRQIHLDTYNWKVEEGDNHERTR